MKKLSILLALVLMFSMLAACNSEDANAASQMIPGYEITLTIGDGWTVIEESEYDLALEKKGMQLYAYGFSPSDFVDMPLAEDMFLDFSGILLASLTDATTVEAESTYSTDDKQIITCMYSGKEGDTAKQFYCFLVDFGEVTGNQAWVVFAAKEGDMKKNRDAFKKMVDTMVCTADPYDYESSLDDEIIFDEEGNPIYDDFTEPEDIPYETEEESVTESNPPEPTTAPATEAATEATAEATTEATVEATTQPKD